MKTVDVHLPFASISNCRDLAGIMTADGRHIRPGKLFRSANLHHASEQDLLTLENMNIADIIDLRTEWEVLFSPDRLPQGSRLHRNPVYHEKDLSANAGGQRKLVRTAATDMASLFEKMYVDMIVNPDSQKAWRTFFKILLESENPVLWHCTQGKDRTGMAAALVLHALGADDQTVLDEYLQTNEYMSRSDAKDRMIVDALLRRAQRVIADEDIDAAMFARKSYFEKAEQAVKEGWGSWNGYLMQALGLQPQDLEKLKEKYLV